MRISILIVVVVFAWCVGHALAADSNQPYKLLKTEKIGGAGGFDYVFADSDGRKLYIPRSGQDGRVTVFDLETLKPAGVIPQTRGVHGATVDPASGHGFCSSSPIVMWDTKTMQTIKTIPVQGNPDGIFYESSTQRVYILSHRAPNVTVIDPKDGSIAGTIDLGGAPEQAAGDGQGHVYIDLEDKSKVAVVDAKAMKKTGEYDLAGKGGTPAGLSMDAKNHILFVCCRNPATCVVMNADDGKIITALPIGAGCDSAAFNPSTLESFSSQRDGTLTVIKEKSPTEFEVEQTVQTKPGAKTCTLDTKSGNIYLITADQQPGQGGGRRGQTVPESFSILVVGK